LEEPCGQTSLFVRGKIPDRFLDGFQRHALNVREMLSRRKWQSVCMMSGYPFIVLRA
jgi:hypothetical protein